VNYRGHAYRAHNPRWSWSPLSGEGAAKHGARFNAKGVPALYLSIDPSTAILEASQGFAFKFQPLTLVAYEVDCADIVDLRSETELRAWDIEPRDLNCPWKLLAEHGRPVPSWDLAEHLRASGQAGIVVPSFAPGATGANINLVLWIWSNELPHKVTVIDDEGRLPRDASSWGSDKTAPTREAE
jgi:RES domain-containing protein